jgi:MerR HTH family regulatory protein
MPTTGGAVTVAVPKWSNTGRALRLKGRGVPRADGSKGDQYVKLMLMLPEKTGFETRSIRRGVAAGGIQSAAIDGSVIMETQEFIGRSHLDTRTLNAWVEAEWLVPVASKKTFQFSEADLARARLIGDLKAGFGVNDEGIAIICSISCTGCAAWSGIFRRWKRPIAAKMPADGRRCGGVFLRRSQMSEASPRGRRSAPSTSVRPRRSRR